MINYISKPFKWFFKLEAASGLILLFAAIIALIVSNSDLSSLYFSTLNKYLFIGINDFGLPQSLIDYSAIKKDVTIIGVLNKIEIWNPNLLRKIDQSDEIDDQSYEELSERVNI